MACGKAKTSSRMLKKSASSVLTSFRPSTYPRGHALASHSLRPCWTAFLSILQDCSPVVPHSRTIEVLACHNSLYPACLDRYGGRVAVAPGPFLVTERDRRGTSTRAEKVFGERLDNGRVIALAAENVEVGVVRIVRKMAADQRGRDQLHHGIAGDAA
jgi:hypothetical protein